jgi:hypothetical protein
MWRLACVAISHALCCCLFAALWVWFVFAADFWTPIATNEPFRVVLSYMRDR